MMRIGLVAIVMLAAAIIGIVWSQQRKLIYFPFGEVPSPEAVGLADTTPVSFRTADGLTLNGWFISRSKTPAVTMIVFNGNAGNRAFRAPIADAFARANISVLLFDYRGYGGNPGDPAEEGLKTDARAARDYVLSRGDVDRGGLVYFGESLGTAVATELALEHPPAALILRSPFTSLTDVGRHHYGFLPVRWLLRDRYDTIGRIARVKAPVLVIGGDQDRIVPIAQTKQLYEAATDPKSMLILKGADHNDEALVEGPEMIDAVLQFLRNLPGTRFHG